MITIYVVDAFVTPKPFSGNPASVCLLESWKSDQWMQNIAQEMNHSETAFIVKTDDGFSIRYFTPTTEIPLCGHATLASAFILWNEGIVLSYESITFYAKGGTLKLKKENDTIHMDFPAAASSLVTDNLSSVTSDLSIHPLAVYQSNNDIVFELTSEQEVETYTPDFNTMKKLPYRMIILTAPSSKKDISFTSRVFAPSAGINEDPATGIAHCILGPIWSKKQNQQTLTAYQASSRGAHITVSVNQERILLTGKARLMIKGMLQDAIC